MIRSASVTTGLSPEAFSSFRRRLAPEAERAGEEYEELRQMLVKFFECRGAVFADELADETLSRVIRRIGEGEAVEHLNAYCFGVARLLLLESLRSPEHGQTGLDALPPLAAPEPEVENDDARLECLRQCLDARPAESRELIVEYYRDERRTKIDVRQRLADRLGIRRNALTRRMVRLRAQLERCITRCVRKNSGTNLKN
ncbi:MAG: hypothetical protein U0Z53_31700 [Blastocatellia bacterium]